MQQQQPTLSKQPAKIEVDTKVQAQPIVKPIETTNITTKPLAVPELTKNVSQMNTFTSKKARKQNWFQKFKQNSKLETDILLKGYNPKKESKSFLITIKGVSGIAAVDIFGKDQLIMGAKYSLEYYMTLYNKELSTSGNFYGRTHRSQPLPLKEVGGQWECQTEELVYFHSSFTEKTSFAVVECVIVKEVINGAKVYASAGYAMCQIFEFSAVTSVDIQKGSPRLIGQGQSDQSKFSRSQGKLTFEMRDFPVFDKIKPLIPQNSLCSQFDFIPGLKSEKFPDPKSGGNLAKVNLELLPTKTIYIHNIQMLTSISFENRFENFLKVMRQEKLRNSKDKSVTTTDNVYISERRILVTSNNTWTNTSETSQVSMGAPNEKGISISGGSLTIKNFICHPLMALMFRIEYKAMMPGEKTSDSAYFTLGWCCTVPNFNAANELTEQDMEEDIEIGPGQSPTGDLLWDPNADDINFYQLKMSSFISVNASPPNAKVITTAKPTLPTTATTNQPKAGMTPQELQIFQEKERQIKDLEARLKQQSQSQNQMNNQIETLEMQRLHQQTGYTQPDARYEDQIKLMSLQKDQLQNELLSMRNEMKNYMSSMQESMYSKQQHPQQFQSQYDLALQGGSQQQIAMIGNVFYNMLNMIGESEKDKKIIGLSDNIKKMVQLSKFEDLLGPKAPYVGIGQINLLKTTDLPLQDQINFIKMGYGDQLQNPTAQVTSSSLVKDKMSLDLEAADHLRACTVSFKFLCLKTPWINLENIPSRFYFELRFFTFPAVLTDKVKIKNNFDHDSHGEIKPGMPYYLEKESMKGYQTQSLTSQHRSDTMHDPNMLSITFEIDPSISRIKDENMKLAEYLKERFLTVDVFDGDSLFLFGTCKIPLYELLRQSRGSVVRAKECEMCDPETGDFRGAIQLIMSNQGRMQSVSEAQLTKDNELKQNSPLKQRRQPSQGQEQQKEHKYKKVVNSKPMDLTKMQQTNNNQNMSQTHSGLAQSQNYNQNILSQMNPLQAQQVSMNNADLRKKLRVDRVRKLTMGTTASQVSVEDPSQPDWAKFKSLREIEMIRETKKDSIISRVLEDYVQGTEQMYVLPGQVEFLRIPIHNPFNQNEVFSIHINDPDEGFLNNKELSLVTDQMEWRHWVSLEKCKRPVAYDMMTPSSDIMLKPNDDVELLFKFISLREQSTDPYKNANSDTIKQRKIQIIIMQSNKQPYSTIEVNIVPCSSPIDHTFRFYEPQNSHVSLTIPPFLQLNHPGLNAVISKATALVDFIKETNSMRIETKTEDAPILTEMLLFVYGDQYKAALLATIKIELYSLVTIYTKIKAGVQSIQNLSLPAESARSVMIHSSNPKLVYLPKRALNQTFRIIPQTVNHIQICVKTFTTVQKQNVRIHCTGNYIMPLNFLYIDVNTGELVYAWLIIIDAEQPMVTKKHEVTCKMNLSSVQSLEYSNRLNMTSVYEFASSNAKFFEPKVEAITFESRESKFIDLYFPPQPKYGIVDVLLFVNDYEYNVVECHQLKIQYVP